MSHTVTFLQVHELIAEANLVLQTAVLILIVVAIFLQRRRKLVWHGNVMLVAAIITLLMLIMHMGPTFIRLSREGIATFNAVTLVGMVHGIIGVAALSLGLWITVVWAYLDSDMKFCAIRKKWMLRILTLWLVALGLGYVYYVIHILWA